MLPIKTSALLLIFTIFLTSCSGGSSKIAPPKIGSIYTDIVHYDQSFFRKWDYSPNSTIWFTIAVNVSDPKGARNLSEIYVHDKVSDRYWAILGGQYNLTQEECYDSGHDIYECVYYSSISLDRINLKNWEIVAENKQGKVSRKNFEFKLPSGEPVGDEEFAYSTVYNDSVQNGIKALEAMTISENELEFSSNSNTQSFHIEFENTDDRATHYSFAFYDGTEDIDSIAQVESNSPSIESMPIIQGQKTALDIPWSEVDFYNNGAISDINGVHIRLYDEPVKWLDDHQWFNYISYSEFVRLSL